MKTELIDLKTQYRYGIDTAAEVIRAGGLAAFPTETVYGLGANGLNGAAVRKIYEAKGRPTDNPSILHVASKEEAFRLWDPVPEKAEKLMDLFWPGPLTIIGKHSAIVPPEVTGGLDTVAVRMPSNTAAADLIRTAGVPIAAPSANLSGRPSPTCAAHVYADLNGRAEVVLDGGPCRYGVESTVITLVGEPTVLRPGVITCEMLASALGEVNLSSAILSPLKAGETAASPGMKYKHYAPEAEVIAVNGTPESAATEIIRMYDAYAVTGARVIIAGTEQTKRFYKDRKCVILGDRDRPETLCASLFYLLREADKDADVILAEGIPAKDAGLAYMNRLLRAAGFHVVEA